jgi:UDP-GlcNAc3NAcA epimerase
LKKAIVIIGARPQFLKHFPFQLACRGKIELITIHTGQHYDEDMSNVFFKQLGMDKPSYKLEIGSAYHGEQTGKMMIEIEKIILKENPNFVVVYGDTNSTLAGALVASKLNITLVHIEAGMRSFNKLMPEEINRILADHMSSLLFCSSQNAAENLKNEGIKNGIFVTGDLMKDLLFYAIENNLAIEPKILGKYYYVTLHRPYNVDNAERLMQLLSAINNLDEIAYFAIHPRTKKNISQLGIEMEKFSRIVLIEPQPYFENLGFLKNCKGLVTDSGGLQKEAYWLKKKCITIRSETEWIETLAGKCNELVFDDLSKLQTIDVTKNYLFDPFIYGDGNASNRMVNYITNLIK